MPTSARSCFTRACPAIAYADNNAPNGSAPPNLEQLQPTCGVTSTSTNSDNMLLAQVECDTRLATCPPGSTYPPQTGVHLAPLPANLPTMADPCSGVPANVWCPAVGSSAATRYHVETVGVPTAQAHSASRRGPLWPWVGRPEYARSRFNGAA